VGATYNGSSFYISSNRISFVRLENYVLLARAKTATAVLKYYCWLLGSCYVVARMLLRCSGSVQVTRCHPSIASSRCFGPQIIFQMNTMSSFLEQ